MFRTIFVKQLAIHLGTLALSFLFLGAVLSQVIRGYFVDQKLKLLEQSGYTLAGELTNAYMYGLMDIKEITMQREIMVKYLKAGMLIVDKNMELVIDSGEIGLMAGDSLSAKELQDLQGLQMGEAVSTQGTLGILPDEQLIVGYPVVINGNMFLSVILFSSLRDLNETIWEMYKAAGICLGMASAVGVALVYLASRTMSKPLRQMSKAAKEISDGDFQKRVTASGRDEVAQLAESLNNMAESLSTTDKSRREFIGNISHDIRSPLTSMRGFIQAMMDGTIPPEKMGHYLEIILGETERLSKLANGVLDWSKTEAENSLELTVFDINMLIRETTESLGQKVRDKKLDMRLEFADSENYVKADGDKIQRVIYNLLDNACKFTPEGGSISIETTVKDQRVYIEVKDTGIGMTPDEQKKVFDRFYKADESRNIDKVGCGLGLSIVKDFLKAHSSQITVKSVPGEGTSFVFYLEEAPRP
ncbi:MAG: HAMP domain-containing histidine kinase [Clostridiales bacterium]|nr:HAMP domain-containing histidine kinase [Clostridiales bacterium]MDR2751163.1 HAMP domain-containing histidine kinase [Clostridiales bacterium]